jgi:hypothetical protein
VSQERTELKSAGSSGLASRPLAARCSTVITSVPSANAAKYNLATIGETGPDDTHWLPYMGQTIRSISVRHFLTS